MQKQPLFRNKEINDNFERDGFVVIDFTSSEMVKEIAKEFYLLHPVIPVGFFCEVSNTDDKLKQDLFLRMDSLLSSQMEETFKDYKKLGCTFLCKSQGEEGKVAAHQDWTVVDEIKFTSATIWIPCQDVDEHNGALMVLPGSHLFFDKYRNNHIPVSYQGSEELISKHMITVPMKAGQAFVLNHAVIHASTLNNSDRERLVIAYAITSADASLSFYFRDKNAVDNKVEKFEMPDDFFLRYNNIGERPLLGEKVAEFQYEVPIIDSDIIAAMIETEREKRVAIPYYQKYWIKQTPNLSPSLKSSNLFSMLSSKLKKLFSQVDS
jgi:hypothetical protein